MICKSMHLLLFEVTPLYLAMEAAYHCKTLLLTNYCELHCNSFPGPLGLVHKTHRARRLIFILQEYTADTK
jgi:hypothetical protein